MCVGVCVCVERTQVFMINLQRRSDRRDRMLRALRMQGIDCKVTAAVDGKYVGFNDVLQTACYQSSKLSFPSFKFFYSFIFLVLLYNSDSGKN